MKIGFIGAGKVGTAFGIYLRQKGFDIAGYSSRSLQTGEKAAHGTASRYYREGKDLLRDSDMVFITTQDGQIQEVCDALAQDGAFRAGQIIIHMSGAHPSSILRSACDKGCSVYSLHPIQAFADIQGALESLPDTVFGIEGDEAQMGVIEGLLQKTGNRYFKIKAEDKALYHAAACIFSNYLVTLMEEGLYYFEKIGIPREEGFKAVLPLITGTVNNIALLGTAHALTGPIARGDGGTVGHHIEKIQETLPEKLPLYRHLAQHTLELAQKEKLQDKDRQDVLNRILTYDFK